MKDLRSKSERLSSDLWVVTFDSVCRENFQGLMAKDAAEKKKKRNRQAGLRR